MIKPISGYKLLFLLLAISFLGTGCVERSAPEVTYYSLLTTEQLGSAQAVGAYPDLSLGIGPVTIPDALKRSQVATRQEGNQYTFSEFHRWAGILENDFSVVLGDNLGALLGVSKVASFPWMPHFKPTPRSELSVVPYFPQIPAFSKMFWSPLFKHAKGTVKNPKFVKIIYYR